MKAAKKVNADSKLYNTAKMNLILYSLEKELLDTYFLTSISNLFAKKQVKLYKDFDNITTDFRTMCDTQNIFVFFLTSKTELDNLFCFKDSFADRSIIVILPNQEQEFLSKAMKLYPRFISYQQTYINDVPLVLQKMIENINKKNEDTQK